MHSVHVYLVGFGCCVVGILFILPTSTHAALDCYVCRDCETTFNASHVVTCSKSTARCVKIVNENGVIDRTCGDANKCGGRDGYQFPAPPPTQRPRRAISHPDGRTRQKRQLLGSKPTQKQQGFKELSSLHCCNENECNGSPPSQLASSTATFLLLAVSYLMRHNLRF
ncbi:uncharacterized protein LOC110845959 [Folsomia candida]|nr:uncharacterized protein LOC110845959 [Folsomia candida]